MRSSSSMRTSILSITAKPLPAMRLRPLVGFSTAAHDAKNGGPYGRRNSNKSQTSRHHRQKYGSTPKPSTEPSPHYRRSNARPSSSSKSLDFPFRRSSRYKEDRFRVSSRGL